MINKRTIPTLLLAAMTLAGCEHKELCYDHSHTVKMDVVFDWTKVQDFDENDAPGSMSLYLFPLEGGEALRYDFPKHRGGTISVPHGRYAAFCHNSDTENVLHRNTETLESFEIYTGDTPVMLGIGEDTRSVPKADGAEDERVSRSPDMLWTDYLEEDIELKMGDKRSSVTLYPEVSVCTYHVEITGVENLKYVSSISGSLSGMAGGFLPWKTRMTEEKVTLPFEVKMSEDKTAITGNFYGFGHCPSKDGDHSIVIYAVLTDGSRCYYTYKGEEVTRQLNEAPDPKNVYIRLNGLPLPLPEQGGGSFKPGVGEWEEVEEDIIM